MKKLTQKFSDSFRELKRTPSLVGLSLLLAMSVVLSFFFRIELSPSLRIGVAFLATAAMGMIYGPTAAFFAAGTGDVIKFLLKPTGPYFFGFTLDAALAGMIYGLFLYKEKPSLWRFLGSKFAVDLFINCILSTFWKSFLYGKGYAVTIYAAFIKNATMLPFEVLLMVIFLPLIYKARKQAARH